MGYALLRAPRMGWLQAGSGIVKLADERAQHPRASRGAPAFTRRRYL